VHLIVVKYCDDQDHNYREYLSNIEDSKAFWRARAVIKSICIVSFQESQVPFTKAVLSCQEVSWVYHNKVTKLTHDLH